jgi:hypothetical protein
MLQGATYTRVRGSEMMVLGKRASVCEVCAVLQSVSDAKPRLRGVWHAMFAGLLP